MSNDRYFQVDHSHFFIADTHLGHTGILDMAMRPFNGIAEHDRDVIANWNSVIKPTDTVWHLGDFAWDKLPINDAAAMFTKLNGIKRLVIGNHDTPAVQAFDWTSTHEMVTLKAGGLDLVLFHYPLREWPSFYSGAIHFHGHTHDNLPSGRRVWDCGVDHQGFTPLTFAQISERMARLPDYDYAGMPKAD